MKLSVVEEEDKTPWVISAGSPKLLPDHTFSLKSPFLHLLQNVNLNCTLFLKHMSIQNISSLKIPLFSVFLQTRERPSSHNKRPRKEEIYEPLCKIP